MKVIIFEGPRGSGKSSLIEDARNYLTKRGKAVECYFLPGTTDATKQMRALALKDSSVSNLSRRLIQIAAGLDDHLNIENIAAQSEADYLFIDRSSHISNFVYAVMAGYNEDEAKVALQTGHLYNDLNSKIDDIRYAFVYADAKTCIRRIRARHKEKDYMDIEMDESRETMLNQAYLGLFTVLNEEALDLYANSFKSPKHPEAPPTVSKYLFPELKELITEYGMNIEFYNKNSMFLLNASTRKRALSDFLFHIAFVD